jgi:murein DD-endopeptidase MepM/ murein hydrolase activator NlpD
MSVRTALLASAALALAACAAQPATRSGPVSIDYRKAAPPAPGRAIAAAPAPMRPPFVSGRTMPPASTAPGPVQPERPSSSPAVQDAAAMAPETGQRPGGALLQPKDDPRARRIEVLRGDSLYDISRRYSVNMRALIETNDLQAPYALNTGQVVYLPPPNIHRVEPGETLYSVSRRYNVDTRSLALINGMSRPWTVWPGDELLLPPLARDQGRRIGTAKVSAPAVRPPVMTPSAKAAVNGPIPLTPGAPVGVANAGRPQLAANPSEPVSFIWPVSGAVLKGFGTGADGLRNDGVNIAAETGADVQATAAGEVVYAGDELVGFGNLILVRHSGGWVSAYAHADRLLVKEGDKVSQGQTIAAAGATGSASRPQVHFELRKGKDPVDPTQMLPALKG